MPFAKITPPPGVVKPGTVYDAKGRWYDTLWVRWYNGIMQAVGGFDPVESGGSQIDAAERVSGTHSWRDNDDLPVLAYGSSDDGVTPSSLVRIYRGGVVYNITPGGLTSGKASSAITSGNYGQGYYGVGLYGVGDEMADALQEGQSFQMDNYGEDLVFVALSDGGLYYSDMDGNSGDPATATLLANAPTSNIGVVVTPENFIFALGAGGNPRKISWADQDDVTNWTPSSTNQAGDLTVASKGAIMCGARSQQETMVWTETDVYSVRFTGGPFIYQAHQVGAAGIISRRAYAVVGSLVYWMSRRGFHVYNGYTESIESPLGDNLFSDLNPNQHAKIWCEVRSEFNEITWHYPSYNSEECNKSVTYNHAEGFWYNNTIARTAGEDRGAIPYPVAFDPSGKLWRHEIGSNYGGATPTAVSGPVEIGSGDRVLVMQSVIPDEKTLGDVDLYIIGSFYPTDTETTYGPYTPANPTDIRITARQVRLKVVQDQPGWRLGTLRADVELGGYR